MVGGWGGGGGGAGSPKLSADSGELKKHCHSDVGKEEDKNKFNNKTQN
jgi:hypothetical protein